MGIQERKLRAKEELKERILQAAKSLFVEKGFEATSMRSIAERMEISPTTIYLYYKEKNDIVYALHKEGFKLLGSQFADLTGIAQPFERLKKMAAVYLRFAAEHPDFYELMFVSKGPMTYVQDNSATNKWVEGTQTYQLLFDIIVACQKAGYFSKQEPHNLSLVTWSALHGICMLKLHGHIDCLNTNDHFFAGSERGKAENIFESYFNMLEKS
jgi:AcrR family transcriptional regulator